jgi:hypothetical protein
VGQENGPAPQGENVTEEPNVAQPDFHHVTLSVTKVSRMVMVRNEHQNIKAIVDAKLSFTDSVKLLKVLAEQVAAYQEGMGPITFSLEGDFT